MFTILLICYPEKHIEGIRTGILFSSWIAFIRNDHEVDHEEKFNTVLFILFHSIREKKYM